MLIAMVFLALLPPPLRFLLPPPLRVLLSIQLMLLSLHRILKLATHTCHQLDHFHSLATSYMRFLPMNIGPVNLSPIDIMVGVINGSYSFNLLVQLATNCPLELLQVVHKILVKHMYHGAIHLVFLHVISRCLISHPNTIFYIYHFHLSLIHC
jgi:hypothetical protein